MNAAAVLTALAVAIAPVTAMAPDLAPETDRLDAALGPERALLSFLPDDVRSGRYTFLGSPHFGPGPEGIVQARPWTGVFWRTSSGNVYTRAEPYDEALVRREVEAFAEHERRDTETDGFHHGPEFQWSLADVIAPRLRPSVGWVGSARGDCRAALDAHRAAIGEAVGRLVPEFRPAGARERWEIDVLALRRATAVTSDHAGRACGEKDTPGAGVARIALERWRGGLSLRLVRSDGRQGGERVVEVTPGPVGPPPQVPDPAPYDLALNDFLLAVNACRGLPWRYDPHVDSYYPPRTTYYFGATAFATGYVCAEDVPPDARTFR